MYIRNNSSMCNLDYTYFAKLYLLKLLIVVYSNYDYICSKAMGKHSFGVSCPFPDVRDFPACYD